MRIGFEQQKCFKHVRQFVAFRTADNAAKNKIWQLLLRMRSKLTSANIDNCTQNPRYECKYHENRVQLFEFISIYLKYVNTVYFVFKYKIQF